MSIVRKVRGYGRRLRRICGLVVVFLFLIGSFVGREAWGQASLERYEYRQTRMGMPVRVVLYAPTDSSARNAGRAAFRRMADLENILSSYRSESELNRLSQEAVGTAVPVSEPLFTVLQRAQLLARQSDGTFDITAGPYFDLWAKAREEKALPDSSALRRAAARVGWKKIHLNEDGQTVRLRTDSMQLNVGGIAKGYILDQALKTLSAHGIQRAMIEAGGDLVVSAPPPNKSGWRVRLPGAGPDGSTRTVRLTHAAVATSGNTHQYVDINGTRYSHVVNPKTGLGLTHHLLVTIIADDGITADGLATTVGLLGPEKGPAFLKEHYPDAESFIRPADSTRNAN